MTEKSRLAGVLGLEEDEEFTTKVSTFTYRVHEGLLQFEDSSEIWVTASCRTLCQIIDDPSLIQHKPRFTDEEMTVLRWLHRHGKLKRFYKTIDGRVGAFADGISSLTGNIADYLLKPGEEVDLNEMFGNIAKED